MSKRTVETIWPALLTALLLGVPAGAMAQDDPLAAEAALLEGKAQAAPPKDEADPNPKLLAEVHTSRKALEKRINEYQSIASEFLDLDEGLQAATQKMMKANEGFFSKHGKLVAEFVNSGSNDKKLIKKIETLRNTFIKNIGKINKDLDTLQKLEKKLRAAVAKEDAEAAKAAAANAEAESPDDAEENEGEQSDGEE